MVVGLEEPDGNEPLLLLYPNPSSGQIQMISDVVQPMEVTVFNIIGQTVYTRRNMTNNDVINLSAVENGLYQVRFFNERVNLLKQVVVQH